MTLTLLTKIQQQANVPCKDALYQVSSRLVIPILKLLTWNNMFNFPSKNPRLVYHARILYTKFYQDWLIKNKEIDRKQNFLFLITVSMTLTRLTQYKTTNLYSMQKFYLPSFVKIGHCKLKLLTRNRFSIFINSGLGPTDPKYNPNLCVFAWMLYSKFRSDWSIQTKVKTQTICLTRARHTPV